MTKVSFVIWVLMVTVAIVWLWFNVAELRDALIWFVSISLGLLFGVILIKLSDAR